MKEYIEREAAIKAIENDSPELVYYSKREAIDCIKAEPAANVVEVVRCKDCENFENGECVNPYIWMSDGAHLWPDEDFYCAKGERRSDQ